MADWLSAATSSLLRPSRLALALSRAATRDVAMRPGTTMLAVMPSLPTSRASVFDQPTSDRRSAFEIARFGMGDMTPDDVLVRMRPQPRDFMPGRTQSVMAMIERTID